MSYVNRAKIGDTVIDLVQGDITKESVDAIVNAANSTLAGGGGVDGAIHRAAGRELLNECLTLGRCPTGEARITKGYKLPAKHVIHAVGPIYNHHQNAPELLASVHTYSLTLAQENNLKSVAFPAISTGIYGYPMREAAPVAIGAVADYIKKHQPDFDLVRFVLFSPDAFAIFKKSLNQILQTQKDLQAD